MARRADEVQARMHAQIALLHALRLLLLAHVRLMLVVDKVDDRDPRIAVVHVVAKTGCVDDRELDFELLLLELGFDDLDLDGLVELLLVTPGVVLGRTELGREERVDECCFSESGFADDHDGEVRAGFGDDFVSLWGVAKKTNKHYIERAAMRVEEKKWIACVRTWLGKLAIPMSSEGGGGIPAIVEKLKAGWSDEGGGKRRRSDGSSNQRTTTTTTKCAEDRVARLAAEFDSVCHTSHIVS